MVMIAKISNIFLKENSSPMKHQQTASMRVGYMLSADGAKYTWTFIYVDSNLY